MRQTVEEITLRTPGPGLTEFTAHAERLIADAGYQTGLLTVFVRHTSASLIIQENADPDVQRDLQAFFHRLVPEADPLYVHTAEGPDDMPAHVKAALTQTSLSIPVTGGRLALGTWQGLYLFEHRRAPHARRVIFHLMGD